MGSTVTRCNVDTCTLQSANNEPSHNNPRLVLYFLPFAHSQPFTLPPLVAVLVGLRSSFAASEGARVYSARCAQIKNVDFATCRQETYLNRPGQGFVYGVGPNTVTTGMSHSSDEVNDHGGDIRLYQCWRTELSLIPMASQRSLSLCCRLGRFLQQSNRLSPLRRSPMRRKHSMGTPSCHCPNTSQAMWCAMLFTRSCARSHAVQFSSSALMAPCSTPLAFAKVSCRSHAPASFHILLHVTPIPLPQTLCGLILFPLATQFFKISLSIVFSLLCASPYPLPLRFRSARLLGTDT